MGVRGAAGSGGNGGPGWRRRLYVAALVLVVSVAVPTIARGESSSHARGASARGARKSATPLSTTPAQGLRSFDSRAKPAAAAEPTAKAAAAQARLTDSIGPQAVVSADPATGGVRSVGQLDGFLTGRSDRSAASVALGYVRDNHAAFGIPASAVDSLHKFDGFTDAAGAHHVSFVQYQQGVPVFGAGLKATVADDGRLLNVVNGPAPNAATRSTDPKLSAAAAVRSALRDGGAEHASPGHVVSTKGLPGTVDTSVFNTGNRASLVDFPTADGGHLAWLVNAYPSSTASYIDVVDATTGEILFRENTTAFDVSATRQGVAVLPERRRPGLEAAARRRVNFPVNGSGYLSGNNAHTYADPLDSIQVPGGTVPSGDEIPSSSSEHLELHGAARPA